MSRQHNTQSFHFVRRLPQPLFKPQRQDEVNTRLLSTKVGSEREYRPVDVLNSDSQFVNMSMETIRNCIKISKHNEKQVEGSNCGY